MEGKGQEINLEALQVAASDAQASAFRTMRLVIEAMKRRVAELQSELDKLKAEDRKKPERLPTK